MRSGITFATTLILLAFTVLCSTTALAATSDGPILYDVTDLGTLGGPTSDAWSINNYGQIVGSSSLPGGATTHAFLYDGTMFDLGTLAGGNSEAHAVNDSGQVAGYSDGHAFLYDDGVMQDLGTLGGTYSTAYSINNAGQVVGYSYATFFGDRDTHAFLFNGEMMDLGTLGGSQSFGYGINDASQVVGFSRTTQDDPHAFLYDGTMIDLGTLGGRESVGYAINGNGQVTGYAAVVGDGSFHLFLYDGVMRDLGTLNDSFLSSPQSINDAGAIVGTALFRSDPARAFLYDGSRILDLNDLIRSDSRWYLSGARAINNLGQIVGIGNHNGQNRAFLLTPSGDSSLPAPW